jgi:hypothetical protein
MKFFIADSLNLKKNSMMLEKPDRRVSNKCAKDNATVPSLLLRSHIMNISYHVTCKSSTGHIDTHANSNVLSHT